MQNVNSPNISTRTIVVAVIALVVIFFLLSLTSNFFYFFERVSASEVGVQFVSGRIKNVVGPGVYSDVGLFVDLERISIQSVAFSVSDAELITRDKQRIGIVVTGDVFRPGLEASDQITQLWGEYSLLFLSDEAARLRIEDRARQSMKVCVGDRNFDDLSLIHI